MPNQFSNIFLPKIISFKVQHVPNSDVIFLKRGYKEKIMAASQIEKLPFLRVNFTNFVIEFFSC